MKNMDRMDSTYFKVNEMPNIDRSVASLKAPGQQAFNLNVEIEEPSLETMEDINLMQQEIIGSADVEIVNLEAAIYAYANDFCQSHGTTLKEVLYADTDRNKYLMVKDAYIEYYGDAQTQETKPLLATKFTANPTEAPFDTKTTMGGEVLNQLSWGVHTTFQIPIPLRVPAPLPPAALVYYNTNLTVDLQGVRNQEQNSSFINFAAQANLTIPAKHSVKAELKMLKQSILQHFHNVIILTGFIAIVPETPIEGKTIWFKPIINVAPYLSPSLFTVENEDLIFKGQGIFYALLNVYPYYTFTIYSESGEQVEKYDYYDISLEADKPLLLAAL